VNPKAPAAVAALLVLGGLACAGAALYGYLGSRDIAAQVVQSGGPLLPMEVALEPAMNPMRITVTAKVDERNRAALPNRRETYQLSLYLNGRPLKRWLAMLSPEDEDRNPRLDASFSVAPVEVAEAGRYHILLLRPEGDIAPAFIGHEVRVQRMGARADDVTLAWLGGILLLPGLVLFLARMLAMRQKRL